jgi:hypothetical protein
LTNDDNSSGITERQYRLVALMPGVRAADGAVIHSSAIKNAFPLVSVAA